jgi:hypothetical protein
VKEFQAGRGWYGYSVGAEKILSFHPVDMRCVIQDASHGPVVMLNIPGVIEKFDPAKHRDGYKPLD